MADKIAERAAKAALKVFKGRKGFDWWWEDLDSDIKKEIREELIAEIDKVIDG